MTLSLAGRVSFGTFTALFVTAALACGGQTTVPTNENGGVGRGGSATGGSGGSGSGGKGGKAGKGGSSVGTSGTGGSGGGSSSRGGAGGLPDFEDPGCPNPPPPLEDYECDPYAKSGCDFGESCYPYVDYPSTQCGQEIFGAVCTPSGQGQQGEGCEAGCAQSHICVVTGEGTQCVQLCNLNAAVPCPGGLVCAAVDIPGIGGCI